MRRSGVGEILNYFNLESNLNGGVASAIEELQYAARQTLPTPFYYHNKRNKPTERVREFLKKGFPCRNNQPFSLRAPYDWGRAIPDDIEWQVERNAFFFVDWLLQAYIESEEPLFFHLASEAAVDWVKYNIIEDLPNRYKWSDIATGVRATYFGFIIDRILRGDIDAEQSDIEVLLIGAAAHFEKLTDPGQIGHANHVIFQALGLASICDGLPRFRKAPEGIEFSKKLLGDIVSKQYSSEGVHLEHSPFYHFWVYERLSQVMRFRFFANDFDFAKLFERIRYSFGYFFHPDGFLCAIGDSDILDARRAAFSPTAEFIGSGGQSGCAPVRDSCAFPDAGYVALKNSWLAASHLQGYVIFNAAFHSRSHKQSDDLCFEWSDFGQRILIDSGKHSYDFSDERFYAMSTRAHNTVEIGNKDYSLDRRPYGSALKGWETEGAVKRVYAKVTHEDRDVSHERVLFYSVGRFLVIIDRLSGGESLDFRQWFHVHSSLSSKIQAGGAVIISGDSLPFPIVSRSFNGLSLEQNRKVNAFTGQKKPRLQGWYSPRYGVLEPNDAFCWEQTGAQSVFVTVFAFMRERFHEEPIELESFSYADSLGESEVVLRILGESISLRNWCAS